MTLKWKACITDADKWRYHAHVYAWRRIFLNADPNEKTSPTDPTGTWFDKNLIQIAAEEIQRNQHHNDHRSHTLEQEGQTITNTLAQRHGYPNFDTALSDGRTYTEVVIHLLATASDRLQSQRSPLHNLGVTNTEHLAAE